MNGAAARELAETRARLERAQAELAAARAQVEELAAELESTNRGIIAPHSELETAREAEVRALAGREIVAERDRIARDLHDLVIHRVFAAGLSLQSIAGTSRQPQTVRRIRGVIDDLDATFRELRTTIFGLHDQPQKAESLRANLIDLTAGPATGSVSLPLSVSRARSTPPSPTMSPPTCSRSRAKRCPTPRGTPTPTHSTPSSVPTGNSRLPSATTDAASAIPPAPAACATCGSAPKPTAARRRSTARPARERA